MSLEKRTKHFQHYFVELSKVLFFFFCDAQEFLAQVEAANDVSNDAAHDARKC